MVAGLDHGFKAAVPVYGCGFIHENSYWLEPRFAKMSDALRKRWADNFDPSRYLGNVKCPMLFVNGTTDFAYPLDSYQKSYSIVRSPVALAVMIGRPHGHIWTFKEVDTFIDSHLTGKPPLAALGVMRISGTTATAQVKSPSPIAKVEFDYYNRRRAMAATGVACHPGGTQGRRHHRAVARRAAVGFPAHGNGRARPVGEHPAPRIEVRIGL